MQIQKVKIHIRIKNAVCFPFCLSDLQFWVGSIHTWELNVVVEILYLWHNTGSLGGK